MALWSQLTVTGRLAPLHDSAAVSVGDDIFVIGGQNPRGIYNDLYIIDTGMHQCVKLLIHSYGTLCAHCCKCSAITNTSW